MKKTLIGMCACLMALGASAGTVFVGTSKDASTVNFNDTSSKRCDSLSKDGTRWYYAESVTREGLVQLKGCWAFFDDKVAIDWGSFMANWDFAGMTPTPYWQRTYGAKSKQASGSAL